MSVPERSANRRRRLLLVLAGVISMLVIGLVIFFRRFPHHLEWFFSTINAGSTPQGLATFQLRDINNNGIDINSPPPLIDGDWHHVAAVRDGPVGGDPAALRQRGDPLAPTLPGQILPVPDAKLGRKRRFDPAADLLPELFDGCR